MTSTREQRRLCRKGNDLSRALKDGSVSDRREKEGKGRWGVHRSTALQRTKTLGFEAAKGR